MTSGKINRLHWLTAAFAATLLLSLFGISIALISGTEGSLLATVATQVALSLVFSPALLALSVPLVWAAWHVLHRHPVRHTVAAAYAVLTAVILIICASMPYPIRWQPPGISFELLVTISGIAFNVAVFAWLASKPCRGGKIECQ